MPKKPKEIKQYEEVVALVKSMGFPHRTKGEVSRSFKRIRETLGKALEENERLKKQLKHGRS